MPEQREAALYENGHATAPPVVCYNSLAGSTSEGYSHTVATTPTSTNLADQNCTPAQSPLYSTNFSNFVHQRPQASPQYTPNYSPCSSPNINYPSTISKANSSNLSFQSPPYTPNYSVSSHTYSPTFSSTSNYSSFSNSNNNNSNNPNTNNNNNNINNSSNNFEYPSTSKNSPKSQHSYLTEDSLSYSSPDSHFNYSKITKLNSAPTPKYTPNYSNFSYFSNSQSKYSQKKDTTNLYTDKSSKSKTDVEICQKPPKSYKDESEVNYNIGDLQQILSKHGSKIKSTQDVGQNLVTDSLLHFFQKKTLDRNQQDNFPCELGDVSQILVSLTNKYKSEENTILKKKDSNEDSKLMNDLLAKIVLEKEEKRFKSFDEKKRIVRKEIFHELNSDSDEKRIKRDAMSHYQEDKSHHKRPSNYGDFNQWDYLSQQDIQATNNHNRRSHFAFGGSSQAHSVAWNPMGMSVPRQTNPYYSNPHGHMMPAHAHAEYRYNQWSNPNHKNVPNIHNAHSQNTVLPQTKLHGDIPNSIQEFGLPLGSTSDLSKLRSGPLIRTPSPEKASRPGVHPDHLASIPSSIRNPSTVRTSSSLPTHPKSVINNPLSDLQILVTSQESENPPLKSDNYQQESVDLSAHPDTSKQKENAVGDREKSGSSANKDGKELSSPVSVIQIQNKQVKSDVKECEKPVELTSKSIEKNGGTEISSSFNVNNLENKYSSSENSVENVKKDLIKEGRHSEESVKTHVIVERERETLVNNCESEEAIPKNCQNNTVELGKKTAESKVITVEKDVNETSASGVEETEKSEIPNGDEKEEKEEEEKEKEERERKNQGSDEGCKESGDSLKRKATDEATNSEQESKKACPEVDSQGDGTAGENADLPTVTSTSAENKSVSSGIIKKAPKKKPSRKSRTVRLSSGQSSSSESHFSSKKFKSIGSKEEGRKKLKKNLCDVVDRRGPFLHVEGSKESPSSVILINFPKGDDEDEKDKSFSKKQSSNAARTKHHNELDYRGRSRNGLFSSTLSARYDAHTTDHTWVCVFCKKGPHYNSMGDLFGPYIISKDENTSLCDFSGDEKDISDAQKRGGRNKKSLRYNNMVEHFQKMSRKLRRTQSSESCLIGMTVISDDQVDQLRYEVWVHEQCAVWSPNVCLIGSRIIGMQEAIWSSVRTMCSKCGAFGANIGCVYRNCPNRSHYYCAKESGWSLEKETFISTCHIHKQLS